MTEDAPATPALPRHARIDPLLLAVACSWGLNNVIYKWLLETFPPAALPAGYITAIGLILLVAMIARKRLPGWRDLLVIAGFGGLLLGAYMGLSGYAFDMTTASEGSLLISTAPLWTAIMAAAMRVERLRAVNWLGALLAMVGVTTVVLGNPGHQAAAHNRLLGDLLMILTAWCYAGFMIVTKRWMDRHGTVTVTCLTFLSGGLMLCACFWTQLRDTPWAGLSVGHWAGFAYMTLIAGLGGMMLWYRAIRLTSASRTAVYQYLVPGVAAICAAIFLHERLTAPQVGGICLTLVGIYFARAHGAAEPRGPRA